MSRAIIPHAKRLADLAVEETGMAAAKRRGKHVGRPRKLTPTQIDHAARQLASRTETISGMAQMFGVSPLTLSRALKEREAKGYAREAS